MESWRKYLLCAMVCLVAAVVVMIAGVVIVLLQYSGR